MKKLVAACLVFVFALAGCYDTTEDIWLRPDGSGDYKLFLDFKLQDQPQAIHQADSVAQATHTEPKYIIVTLLPLGAELERLSSLSPEQKAVLAHASAREYAHLKKNIFQIFITIPFQQATDLEGIQALLHSNECARAIAEYLHQPFLSTSETESKSPALLDLNFFHQTSATRHSLDREVNHETYDILHDSLARRSAGMVKNAAGDETPVTIINNSSPMLFGSSRLTTVIHLPTPAKKVVAPAGVISADKKTITIRGDYDSLYKNANLISYHIEY